MFILLFIASLAVADDCEMRVAVLGDSLAVNVAAELSSLFSETVSWVACVDDYGIVGETAEHAAKRIRADKGNLKLKNVNLKKYKFLVVLTGINDLDDPEGVIRNLVYIYVKAHACGVKVIAITIPPWHGSKRWNFGRQQSTDKVNAFIRSASVDGVVDAYNLLRMNGGMGMKQEYRMPDRLHLSKLGAGKIAVKVQDKIMLLLAN